MSSLIHRALTALFPRVQARVLFLGLDATGRTTLLYRLRLGEVVTTMPTIGFNVETLEHAGREFTIWDVGGCDKIRPLWRHYFQNTDCICMFVDMTDRDRLRETMEEAQRLFDEDTLKGLPVIWTLTKTDLPNCMGVEEVQRAAREVIGTDVLDTHSSWWICVSAGVPGPDPPGINDFLAALVAAVEGREGGGDNNATAATTGATTAADGASEAEQEQRKRQEENETANERGEAPPHPNEQLLEQWLLVEDEDDDEFIAKLRDFSLATWDHRTHLRIAWLYLERYGRREGMDRVFEDIRAFIANSPRTTRARGTTFHATLTYCFVHLVHWARAAQTVAGDGSFHSFLLMNPQLSNFGIVFAFYSKQHLMQNPEARAQVVLPDRRPLPSIITDTAALAAAREAKHAGDASATEPADMDDEEFMRLFRDRALPAWGHSRQFLRAVYLLLVEHGRVPGALDRILGELAHYTGEDNAHVTVNAFWVHMVWYTMAQLGLTPNSSTGTTASATSGDADSKDADSKQGAEDEIQVAVQDAPSFAVFLEHERECRTLHDPDLVFQFYSESFLHGDDSEAATQLLPPDIQALPSLIHPTRSRGVGRGFFAGLWSKSSPAGGAGGSSAGASTQAAHRTEAAKSPAYLGLMSYFMPSSSTSSSSSSGDNS